MVAFCDADAARAQALAAGRAARVYTDYRAMLDANRSLASGRPQPVVL